MILSPFSPIDFDHSPIFQFLSTETWIHKEQKAYYKALEKSDKNGSSTPFIEFSLDLILKEIEALRQQLPPQRLSANDRIKMALGHFGKKEFSRKDYQAFHKNISAATASRDLKRGTRDHVFIMIGTTATATYKAAI